MKTTLHNPKPSKRDSDIVGGIVVLILYFLSSIVSLQVLKYVVNYVTSDVEIRVIQEKK